MNELRRKRGGRHARTWDSSKQKSTYNNNQAIMSHKHTIPSSSHVFPLACYINVIFNMDHFPLPPHRYRPAMWLRRMSVILLNASFPREGRLSHHCVFFLRLYRALALSLMLGCCAALFVSRVMGLFHHGQNEKEGV